MPNNPAPAISSRDLRRIRRWLRQRPQAESAKITGVSIRTLRTIARQGKCSKLVLNAVLGVVG